ncbi:MAG: HigA family addiction module antitoxin [Bacteroidota bacterium]|jgi:addiction module HigA family antidote
MKKSKNNHPGKTLTNDFLKPSGISGYKLATDINIPQTRVSEIIRGNRRITADTALRFSKYFNNSASYWLNLQNEHDLELESKKLKSEIKKIKAFSNNSSKKKKK